MKQLLGLLLLLSGSAALAQPGNRTAFSAGESFYQRHKTVLVQQFGRLASEADLRYLLTCIIDHQQLEADYNPYFQPSPAPLAQLIRLRHADIPLSQIKSDLVYPLLRFVLPRATVRPVVGASSAVGERIAAQAYHYLGVQYGAPVFDRHTGQGTLDCSGLVRYVFEDLGVGLRNGNSVASLVGSADLKPVAGEPRPGDLLVRKHGDNRWAHVGIFVGNGQLIEAPYTGTVVRTTPYQPAKWHRTLRYTQP